MAWPLVPIHAVGATKAAAVASYSLVEEIPNDGASNISIQCHISSPRSGTQKFKEKGLAGWFKRGMKELPL